MENSVYASKKFNFSLKSCRESIIFDWIEYTYPSQCSISAERQGSMIRSCLLGNQNLMTHDMTTIPTKATSNRKEEGRKRKSNRKVILLNYVTFYKENDDRKLNNSYCFYKLLTVFRLFD